MTYGELYERATALAATLLREEPVSDPPLTAVFAHRSEAAFVGILAALLRGHGYVPLNRTFPAERTAAMLKASRCGAIVVDGESEKQLGQLLAMTERSMLIVLPDRGDVGELVVRWPDHRFIGAADFASSDEWRPVMVPNASIAYLLFTSGSTGVPKGVMVSHDNVRHYVDFIVETLAITHADRFSQMFDMTFDLAVADTFVAWERGACVCCPSDKAVINPGRFINDAQLTVWFSVPSTAIFMKRLGMLKPAAYPGLRVSMFCGEALPVEIVKAWAEAAPNSVVKNLYGPTETTIACTQYDWAGLVSESEAIHGIVPIGRPFPGMVGLIVDESFNEVGPAESGELLVGGPQVSLGYWYDEARTAASFVKVPGHEGIYYRTGDRVMKKAPEAPLLYLGRLDDQMKILGHRVELGEIEAVVREESGIDAVVAVGWPRMPSGAGGIEMFLQTDGTARPHFADRVASRLPAYMVPRRYHYMPSLPLNANGKYDRRALLKLLGDAP
jgi:amino acid adenylation domain-containing protein